MATHDDPLVRQHRRRFATLVIVVCIATLIAASDPLHRAARGGISAAESVIERHAIAGAVVFVLLSALSAMVVFLSTAVVTPIAVEAFGARTTFLLLWLGWIIGGVAAWTVGRFLGRRVASWFVEPRQLFAYERRARRLASFRHMVLFQLAVPSEIPGYVLGLAGCRLRTFVFAMALGELPFAIGAVYLGESFLARNYVPLLAVGIGGVALSWFAFHRARRAWSLDGDAPEAGPMPLVMENDDGGSGTDDESRVLGNTHRDATV